MQEGPAEVTCMACGKPGVPQTAPVGDALFCPHCGAVIEEAYVRLHAPGVEVEIAPGGTKGDVNTGELASGAGTVIGWAFGGLAGLALSLVGTLLGGMTRLPSEDQDVASAHRSRIFRSLVIAGLGIALVVGFLASPGGSIFITPLVGLVLIAGYVAFQTYRR